jgi:outer membrane receptor protein involved in Fe transport
VQALYAQITDEVTQTESVESKEDQESVTKLEKQLPVGRNGEIEKKKTNLVENTSYPQVEVNKESKEVYIMDDFVVSSEDDVGYYSANTLAGTRTNELTKNVPMTISTINEETIKDFGMTGLEDLGNFVPSIEAEGSGYENKAIRFRGFVARNQLFEFMPRYSPLGFYMVERTDVVRGANSLIYGQADPGGKVNVISKVAKFNKDETKLSASFGDKNYHKLTLDKNILIGNTAAIRVMATDEYTEYTQRYKFRDFKGAALEASYSPTKNTRLRFHIDIAEEERSVIYGTFRVGQGSSGLPSGFTADSRMANLISDEYLDYLVNYNDGSLRGNGPQVVAEGINIHEQYGIDSDVVLADPTQLKVRKGPLVPDYITGRESLREMFSGITPENTATAYGPDSVNNKDSYFILGEVTHKFSDNLELKLAIAHEDVTSASRTAGFSSNTIQHTFGYGTSILPPNLPYGQNITTDDLYENSRAPQLLETFNDLYTQEGSAQALDTLRNAIQTGIDNWRANAGNAFNTAMDDYFDTLDPNRVVAEAEFADQILKYYINEDLDFEQLTLEGIAKAHGGVTNYLNRFAATSDNKPVRVGDKVWALTGNNDDWGGSYAYSTQKALDTYIYKEFERLYQLFNPSGSLERPHGGGSKLLWSTNKFVDINKLQERVHDLGSGALSAIFDDETLISNFIMTYEGGMTAYNGVDTNRNGKVDAGIEAEINAQRTAIANDVASRLLEKSDPNQYTASEFWDSLRGIKDLFEYHLNGEVKIGWAWTGTLFPSLVNHEQVDSITTDSIGEGGVINPSLLTNSNGISVPYIKSLWEQSHTNDNNNSARLTWNYSPDESNILGSQKFLFGVDLDRREASKTTEEQYLEGTINYDHGVVLNEGVASQYAILDEILKANFVRRFDMNQNPLDLPGTTASAVAALQKMSTNPNNETSFKQTYAAETTVDTIGLWAAASGSYFNGRLRTLFGVRADTITVESSYTDFKIKALNGTLDPDNPVETFPNVVQQSVKYNNRINSLRGRDDDSLEMFFTPSLGGLFWLTDQLGIFGNYSRSVISPTGFQYDVFGELTPPETGEGVEGGLKFSSNDGKINLQMMLFRIDKKNDQRSNLDWTQLRAIYPDNIPGKPEIYDYQPVYNVDGDLISIRKVFDPLGYRVANEEIRSEGIELDLYYNPFKQLSIFFGYAFLDTTILKSSLDVLEGLELPGTAAHNANIYLRYNFPWESKLRGWFVSLNQKYRSAALLNNYFEDLDKNGIQDYTPLVDKDQNTVLDNIGNPVRMPRHYPVRMQDQFLTDLGIGWSGKIGKSKTAPQLRVQLNVSNLFDTMRLFSTGKNQARYNESRSCRLTATMTF